MNLSYQYLIAKDKEVIRELKNGEIYKRSAYQCKQPVDLSDYKGLYNRSKHSGNISIRYNNDKLKGSVMIFAKYRGKFGYNGLDGFNDGNDI